MNVSDVENKAWSIDGIRIVIRAPENDNLKNYPHKNGAQANWSVTKYLESRIKPLLGDREVVVLSGDGEQPHGRTLLNSVRDSYK